MAEEEESKEDGPCPSLGFWHKNWLACGNNFVLRALSISLMSSGELDAIKAQASSVMSRSLLYLLYIPVIDMLIQLSFTLLLLLSC
ncbi:hypothetical protein AVEN_146897-1 [Araneus ventricosus]|uniref:Uncharacterized protein n=1 Tax=Araneus ventricosus TaxID=182803 RepID=A0A4Y2TC49_ARAVE|nr:hypothetical protein AVEN_146897-1 [Araneus ventricosus]